MLVVALQIMMAHVGHSQKSKILSLCNLNIFKTLTQISIYRCLKYYREVAAWQAPVPFTRSVYPQSLKRAENDWVPEGVAWPRGGKAAFPHLSVTVPGLAQC